MRELTYYIGMTIDGYIAGPGGETDLFPTPDDVMAFIGAEYPETLPTHVREALGIDAPNRRFDTVVMGRATYQPALDAGIEHPYAHLDEYVVSSAGPERDPVALVRRLKAMDGLGVWLCGGGRLAAALLGEIDELVVKQYPVVAGAGIPLFAGSYTPSAFTLVEARPFASGAVVHTYRPATY